MPWNVIGASARGSSHHRSGLPNQDACEFRQGDRSSALRAVLAVSDGHGGSRHFRSQVGSTLAVNTAVNVLFAAFAESAAAPVDSEILAIAARIAESWRDAVLSDFRHHAFLAEELQTVEAAEGAVARASVEEDPLLAYGATLLATVVTDDFILYLQLGDGDILTVEEDGATNRPIAADDRLMANQTTSLCQAGAAGEFRSKVATQFPALILMATDGYANSFRSDADFLRIGADYLGIIRKQGLDSLAEELPAILAGASQEGSGDDITLGILQRVGGGSPKVVESPPRKGNQMRIISIAGASLVLAGLLYFFRLTYCCAPVPPPVSPVRIQPIAAAPAKPTTLPGGKVFALALGSADGAALELHVGDQILFNALHAEAEPSSQPYAEVRRNEKGGVDLVNLGPDTWTIQKPGKKTVEPPLGHGASITLAPNLRITFRNDTTATVQMVAATRPGNP